MVRIGKMMMTATLCDFLWNDSQLLLAEICQNPAENIIHGCLPYGELRRNAPLHTAHPVGQL
ncbi:MAG: hypothetical protein KDK30_06080 [Leptospiraceae bacterium]|nr:hypothetical protein [Leptospiraceae bacterium]